MVRAHEAARAAGLKLLPGAEFGVTPSAGTRDVLFRFVVLAHDLQAVSFTHLTPPTNIEG